MSNNPHIGSTLDDFLFEEGVYEQTNEVATERVLVWQIEERSQEQELPKDDKRTLENVVNDNI